MRVAVIGLGYVGLVTAAGASSWRHETIGVDADHSRVEGLRRGFVPIHEPGLDEEVASGLAASLLHVTDNAAVAVSAAEIVFVAVGTEDGDGGWQTATITTCLESIAAHIADDATLVIRSTLPPAYLRRVPALVRDLRAAVGRRPVPVLLNPEFTKEGTAVSDFLEPDRVVIGRIDDVDGRGAAALRRFYRAVAAPVVEMDGIDASLAKLGSNLFLATKISFANELAGLCDTYGANVDHVVVAMGLDPRIGGRFMRPGVGYGGSCLPHQVSMTIREASAAGTPALLLEAVDAVNRQQRERFVDALDEGAGRSIAGARVALLGLTFKPDTDDLRDAPSLAIARELLRRGATVAAHDPMGAARARAGELVTGLEVCDTVQEVLYRADVVGLVTEWPEYLRLDWPSVARTIEGKTVVDGRNALPRAAVEAAGMRYRAFGRGASEPSPPAIDVGAPIAARRPHDRQRAAASRRLEPVHAGGEAVMDHAAGLPAASRVVGHLEPPVPAVGDAARLVGAISPELGAAAFTGES